MIREDLAASPFVGEGHRPVWARLRFVHGVKVAQKRVLRLMREHQLLSPHRRPKGEPQLHDGRITTDRPDEIWATDGANVMTVDDGKVWVFVAVDHFNAECVGTHVAKEGTRFAALQPIAAGLTKHRGGTECDAGRGITMRQDHGSQYTSETYRDQVKAWGMALSFAFVGEPQTNGVAERFIRTLKEQVVKGRTYRGVEDLRAAVDAFVDAYNRLWRPAKLGFKTPLEARAAAAEGGMRTAA
jgi:transposase InsO family protein